MDASHFRKDARRGLSLLVQFKVDTSADAPGYDAELYDLGMGGAFVHTEVAMAIGTTLSLTVSAPTAWDPIELPAEVRWLSNGAGGRPRGFGVHFLPLGKTQAAALYDLIQAMGYQQESE